jgi:hypothetical protein
MSGSTTANTSGTIGSPATTPALRATIAMPPRSSGATSKSVVMSPENANPYDDSPPPGAVAGPA